MQNKRNVLVTGGCGFIGANFVRLLRISRPDWRVINLDADLCREPCQSPRDSCR